MSQLCLRLRESRLRRRLDQSELARLAGIAVTSISHFESGRRSPSVGNLVKLADVLRVSVDYLLGRGSDVVQLDGLTLEDLQDVI